MKSEGGGWGVGGGVGVLIGPHFGGRLVVLLGGGGGGGSGLWSEPASSLGFHSACTCVFVCGIFLQLLNHQTPTDLMVSESDDDLLSVTFSPPTFTRLFRRFSTPAFLIGTCMKWASLRRLCVRSQSTPLLATR